MLRILYWNIKRKGNLLIEEIRELSREIDILIISELSEGNNKLKLSNECIENIIDKLSKATSLTYIGSRIDSWIHVWVRKNDNLNVLLVDKYDALKKVSDIVDKDQSDSEYFAEYLNKQERMLFYEINFKSIHFLLVPIHFPSRLYASIIKQKDISVHFRNYIEKVEDAKKLDSIVIGDFNMNPFELGMIHHEGFHALPAQTFDTTRTFYGTPYKIFYNPTWSKFGDVEIKNGIPKQKPAGSYFSSQSNDICYYWHIFDQVIMRKSLINKFSHKDFGYITSVFREDDLLNKDLSPNDKKYSDHLPLKFFINL